MCNCGSKRKNYQQQVKSNNVTTPISNQSPAHVPVSFEYMGKTALTVFGRVTGLKYRFSGPSVRLNIDPRDIPGLEKVPVLRQTATENSSS